jgi:hypothetical protein
MYLLSSDGKFEHSERCKLLESHYVIAELSTPESGQISQEGGTREITSALFKLFRRYYWGVALNCLQIMADHSQIL